MFFFVVVGVLVLFAGVLLVSFTSLSFSPSLSPTRVPFRSFVSLAQGAHTDNPDCSSSKVFSRFLENWLLFTCVFVSSISLARSQFTSFSSFVRPSSSLFCSGGFFLFFFWLGGRRMRRGRGVCLLVFVCV